jgi:Zinc-binding dehydrogenase
VLGTAKRSRGKQIRVEAFMATPDASLLRQMADAVRDGKLVIPIARKMKLSEAGEAQTLAEKGSYRQDSADPVITSREAMWIYEFKPTFCSVGYLESNGSPLVGDD